MMLRSKSKNCSNIPVDPRHKRKPEAQLDKGKNPLEPMAKKSQNKGLCELSNGISEFLIDSTKRAPQVVKKNGKENVEVITLDEDVVPAANPVDPCPNFDFDREEAHNPDAVSDYAMDIFRYYKSREKCFRVDNYMPRHPHLDPRSRAILVDWLVEMQETFELNHETLYNAVKIVDLYLSKTRNFDREDLQRLASAAIFSAAKFDERSPPLADDLVYLTNDRFSRDDLLAMERDVLRTIGFDIGAPSSYRYLRRLGRVCRVDMRTLTLARYLLESSLLIFEYSTVSTSRMAGAAFLLAMKMHDKNYQWNPVLEKYSGYTGEDVLPLMEHLNHSMHFIEQRWTQIKNIREKYSHEVFFTAASVPLLPVKGYIDDVLPELPEVAFP